MNNWITLAAAVVGEKYTVNICQSGKYYKAEVSRRDKTHTYLKHKHGETALPNNITIDLLALKPHE